jgi:hypothetical protein
MIVKIFMFQFVNSYASFFFLAFVARAVNECPANGCMSVLGSNLAIIFGTRIVSGNISEILLPWLKFQWKIFWETKEAGGVQLSRPEEEYVLDQVCEVVLNIIVGVETSDLIFSCILRLRIRCVLSLFPLLP